MRTEDLRARREMPKAVAEREDIPSTFKAHIVRESKKALLLRVVDKGVERGEHWIPRLAIIKIEG